MAERLLNPELVRQQIANLRLLYPELTEDAEAWLLSIESETNVTELLRRIERNRQEANAFVGAIANNIGAMIERQKRFERREQAMRSLAFKIMQAADMQKAELPEATLSIRNGAPKVLIVDEEKLPSDAWRIKREIAKDTIKSWLNAGQTVPGAFLSNAEPFLSIRTK